MNINEAQRILNIHENSSLDDIKKSFRREILKIHPDLNNSIVNNDKTKILIESYKILLQHFSERKKKDNKLFETKYKNIFNSDYKTDLNTPFKIIKNIFIEFDKLIYKKENTHFFKELLNNYSEFLLDKNFNLSNYIIAILENVDFVFEIINDKNINQDKDYYKIEKLRYDYNKSLKEIFSINNYLKFRLNIVNIKNILLKDSLLTINSLHNTKLRQEVFSYMTIITLLTEDEFIDSLVEYF